MASQQIPVNQMYPNQPPPQLQQQQQQPQQPPQQQQQPSQTQQLPTDTTHNSDTSLLDPINKSKDLLPQLKQSLFSLMQQLVLILTPNSENNKVITENQFQILGKYIENFDRVCDLMIVNLRTAHEVQQTLTLLQSYERIAFPDPTKNESAITRQVNRINDIRNTLQKFILSKTD